ncbi:MalY/PatB family protein [Levilactobacillus zymae]|uniref:cysteine-S-conjugate beta-lyase n=1 Tax=Levilactobacillus zymae TaxID=267363 RepID=A0A1Y6JW08_9LACO|nr:MalY/PatB family protein [Levilactobacillus zymae]KRL15046.1 bifunctional beta-cystathionase maltose regulon repressor [Levilactobacillus zymae DSM 19395]QFR61625.1 putative C-S lyase [Levilactobacillus zymae]GEO72752.1 cystathionine beta-lyase [Levilactobacillus zymae]SMS13311.1 Aspartate aminotransferase [Levilactobacillus zymae]
MTKFDFSEMIDRRHTNSVKWDVKDNELPMWVADMDFRTAPGIVKAIQDKAVTGIFGYEEVPEAYFEAVQHWYATEHDWAPNTAWMRFATGVVPTISSAVRRVSNVGDNVLIQAPVYNIFYNSIVNNGRHILSSDLIDQNGTYAIDWDDLNAKMADPLTTMMILCNPHNPVGKVWTAAELTRIGELAAANHVTVLSDEIHGDITDADHPYTPFASVNDVNAQNSITCVSTSKTFNVAALHAATVIIPNEALRNLVDRGLNTDELAEPNAFAIPGVIAAYTTGADWVHGMNAQVTANKQTLTKFITKHLPELQVIEGHATYLVWIDCRNVTHDTTALCDFIRAQTGLFITAGAVYGGDGHDFVRINVACPAERLKDGLHRLAKGVDAFKAQND